MSDNQHKRPPTSDSTADCQQPLPGSEEARRKEAHRRMRRRLFRAGLAAVPAMLTLRARPALAQQNPSGTVSQLPDYGQKGHWECSGVDGYWVWTGFIDPNIGYPIPDHWDGVAPDPEDWERLGCVQGGSCNSSGSLEGPRPGWLSDEGDGADDADCCGDEEW